MVFTAFNTSAACRTCEIYGWLFPICLAYSLSPPFFPLPASASSTYPSAYLPISSGLNSLCACESTSCMKASTSSQTSPPSSLRALRFSLRSPQVLRQLYRPVVIRGDFPQSVYTMKRCIGIRDAERLLLLVLQLLHCSYTHTYEYLSWEAKLAPGLLVNMAHLDRKCPTRAERAKLKK